MWTPKGIRCFSPRVSFLKASRASFWPSDLDGVLSWGSWLKLKRKILSQKGGICLSLSGRDFRMPKFLEAKQSTRNPIKNNTSNPRLFPSLGGSKKETPVESMLISGFFVIFLGLVMCESRSSPRTTVHLGLPEVVSTETAYFRLLLCFRRVEPRSRNFENWLLLWIWKDPAGKEN